MIKKVIQRFEIDDSSSNAKNLQHWLSRPVAERIAAVDFLRKQYIGNTERLQRTARVIEQT